MKSISHLLVLFLISSCTIKDNNKLPEYKILAEVKDDKDRLIKRVTTGYQPGEDVYLIIENFDTLGHLVLEYGAKPYGDKYKTEYKYDSLGRIVWEFQYDFNSEQFEHYRGGEESELNIIQDTIADFSSTTISRKINYQFDDSDNLVRERIYDLYVDSVSKETKFQLSFDTTYNKDRLIKLPTY